MGDEQHERMPHATHSPHYSSRSCFRSHPDRINVARLGGALLPARGRLGLSRQLPVQNFCPMQGYSIRHKRRLRHQSAICVRAPRADTAAARYEQRLEQHRLEQQRLEQLGLEQRQPEQPWRSGWRLEPRYVQALSVGAAVIIQTPPASGEWRRAGFSGPEIGSAFVQHQPCLGDSPHWIKVKKRKHHAFNRVQEAMR